MKRQGRGRGEPPCARALVRRRLGIPGRTAIEPLLGEYVTDMRARRRHKSAGPAIGRLKKHFGAPAAIEKNKD